MLLPAFCLASSTLTCLSLRYLRLVFRREYNSVHPVNLLAHEATENKASQLPLRIV
jgi:hypothetical protein